MFLYELTYKAETFKRCYYFYHIKVRKQSCYFLPIDSTLLVRLSGISVLFGRVTLKVPQSKPGADFIGERPEMLPD